MTRHGLNTKAVARWAGSLRGSLSLFFGKEGHALSAAGAAVDAAARASSAATGGTPGAQPVASRPTSFLLGSTSRIPTSSNAQRSTSSPWSQRVAARAFTSRAQIWEHLPSRKAQFLEAVKLAELLPHRASYSPQFTPHGVQLIPKAVMQQQQQQQLAAVPAAGSSTPMPSGSHVAAHDPAPAPVAKRCSSTLHHWGAEEDELKESGQLAMELADTDRTKVWRRLKIKKHKIKKRRKANRYKST